MKKAEIFDKHADHRKSATRQPKKKNRGGDDFADRKARVSFKNYVRQIRDSELADDIDDLDSDD